MSNFLLSFHLIRKMYSLVFHCIDFLVNQLVCLTVCRFTALWKTCRVGTCLQGEYLNLQWPVLTKRGQHGVRIVHLLTLYTVYHPHSYCCYLLVQGWMCVCVCVCGGEFKRVFNCTLPVTSETAAIALSISHLGVTKMTTR